MQVQASTSEGIAGGQETRETPGVLLIQMFAVKVADWAIKEYHMN